MFLRLSILTFLLFFGAVHAGPDNNLYDRNRRDANCDSTGCVPRRPPYYMPKGYVVNPDEEDEEEGIAEIESDQEAETGCSQRLIF